MRNNTLSIIDARIHKQAEWLILPGCAGSLDCAGQWTQQCASIKSRPASK